MAELVQVDQDLVDLEDLVERERSGLANLEFALALDNVPALSQAVDHSHRAMAALGEVVAMPERLALAKVVLVALVRQERELDLVQVARVVPVDPVDPVDGAAVRGRPVAHLVEVVKVARPIERRSRERLVAKRSITYELLH
jgi:hypothetical protein